MVWSWKWPELWFLRIPSVQSVDRFRLVEHCPFATHNAPVGPSIAADSPDAFAHFSLAAAEACNSHSCGSSVYAHLGQKMSETRKHSLPKYPCKDAWECGCLCWPAAEAGHWDISRQVVEVRLAWIQVGFSGSVVQIHLRWMVFDDIHLQRSTKRTMPDLFCLSSFNHIQSYSIVFNHIQSYSIINHIQWQQVPYKKLVQFQYL